MDKKTPNREQMLAMVWNARVLLEENAQVRQRARATVEKARSLRRKAEAIRVKSGRAAA